MTTTTINSYWLTFRGNESACVDAADATEASKLGAQLRGRIVAKCRQLPNPAEPRLNALVPGPAYCHQPETCAGSYSCRARNDCAG
jgi:hypothetical protein